MYIPFYGNYLQVERLLSEEERSRPFGQQAADAIVSGSIAGITFGIGLHFFPSHGGVLMAQRMVAGVSSVPSLIPLAVPLVLAGANFAVIESAPEEKQRGMWQMFSSGLTGTFGGDYSGLV